MRDIVLSLVGALVGWFVSRHYYRKSVRKSLTPYVYTLSRLLAGVDEDARRNLQIRFLDKDVPELTVLQLLIANDGDRPIRDCVEPLRLHLPPRVGVLDATVLYERPEGIAPQIEIEANGEGPSIVFRFALLNANDYFLIKFLLSGTVRRSDLRFSLRAEDLPTAPTVKSLPPTTTSYAIKTAGWGFALTSWLLLLTGAAMFYGMHLLWTDRPSIFPYPWNTYEFSVLNLGALILCGTTALLLFLLGGILVLGIGLQKVQSRQGKFFLPKALRKPLGFSVNEEELRTATEGTSSNAGLTNPSS